MNKQMLFYRYAAIGSMVCFLLNIKATSHDPVKTTTLVSAASIDKRFGYVDPLAKPLSKIMGVPIATLSTTERISSDVGGNKSIETVYLQGPRDGFNKLLSADKRVDTNLKRSVGAMLLGVGLAIVGANNANNAKEQEIIVATGFSVVGLGYLLAIYYAAKKLPREIRKALNENLVPTPTGLSNGHDYLFRYCSEQRVGS